MVDADFSIASIMEQRFRSCWNKITEKEKKTNTVQCAARNVNIANGVKMLHFLERGKTSVFFFSLVR